jgi:hypothetical protein
VSQAAGGGLLFYSLLELVSWCSIHPSVRPSHPSVRQNALESSCLQQESLPACTCFWFCLYIDLSVCRSARQPALRPPLRRRWKVLVAGLAREPVVVPLSEAFGLVVPVTDAIGPMLPVGDAHPAPSGRISPQDMAVQRWLEALTVRDNEADGRTDRQTDNTARCGKDSHYLMDAQAFTVRGQTGGQTHTAACGIDSLARLDAQAPVSSGPFALRMLLPAGAAAARGRRLMMWGRGSLMRGALILSKWAENSGLVLTPAPFLL